MPNLGELHEAIAAAIPEREALVFRERRFSWSDVTDRTRRLADVLRRQLDRFEAAHPPLQVQVRVTQIGRAHV